MQSIIFIRILSVIPDEYTKNIVLETYLQDCKLIDPKDVVHILKLYKNDYMRIDALKLLVLYRFNINNEFMNIINVFDGIFVKSAIQLLRNLYDLESDDGIIKLLNDVKCTDNDYLDYLMCGYNKYISLSCFITIMKYVGKTQKLLHVIHAFIPFLYPIQSFGEIISLLDMFMDCPNVQQYICSLIDIYRLFDCKIIDNDAQRLNEIVCDKSCYEGICKIFKIHSIDTKLFICDTVYDINKFVVGTIYEYTIDDMCISINRITFDNFDFKMKCKDTLSIRPYINVSGKIIKIIRNGIHIENNSSFL
jgi:hypothetical protein